MIPTFKCRSIQTLPQTRWSKPYVADGKTEATQCALCYWLNKQWVCCVRQLVSDKDSHWRGKSQCQTVKSRVSIAQYSPQTWTPCLEHSSKFSASLPADMNECIDLWNGTPLLPSLPLTYTAPSMYTFTHTEYEYLLLVTGTLCVTKKPKVCLCSRNPFEQHLTCSCLVTKTTDAPKATEGANEPQEQSFKELVVALSLV